MESFLLQNAARHQHLVKQFKPKPRATKSEDTSPAHPSIRVATRIRPLLEDESSSGQVPAAFPRSGENGTVDLHELRRVVRGPPPLNVSELRTLRLLILTLSQSFSFRAGRVFGPESTTESIYEDLIQPLLPWAWEGRTGTLFAYGQTGSGKTFTVSGIERLVAKSLFDGSLQGSRKVYITIFELAGNSAFGQYIKHGSYLD